MLLTLSLLHRQCESVQQQPEEQFDASRVTEEKSSIPEHVDREGANLRSKAEQCSVLGCKINHQQYPITQLSGRVPKRFLRKQTS